MREGCQPANLFARGTLCSLVLSTPPSRYGHAPRMLAFNWLHRTDLQQSNMPSSRACSVRACRGVPGQLDLAAALSKDWTRCRPCSDPFVEACWCTFAKSGSSTLLRCSSLVTDHGFEDNVLALSTASSQVAQKETAQQLHSYHRAGQAISPLRSPGGRARRNERNARKAHSET